MRKEYNPGGRFELPQVMGLPGGKLDEQCVGQIMANVYQNWDSKQLHVMMRGSNDIRKLKKKLSRVSRKNQTIVPVLQRVS